MSQFHVLVVPAVDQRGGKRRKLELDGRFAVAVGAPLRLPTGFGQISVKSAECYQNISVSVRARKCFYGVWDRRGKWQYLVRRPRRGSELQLYPKPVSERPVRVWLRLRCGGNIVAGGSCAVFPALLSPGFVTDLCRAKNLANQNHGKELLNPQTAISAGRGRKLLLSVSRFPNQTCPLPPPGSPKVELQTV